MKRVCLLVLCLVLLGQAALPGLAEASVEEIELSAEAAEAQPEEVGEASLLNSGLEPGVSVNAETGSITLGVKEKYTLSVPGATFKSSKKSVATVNAKGVITAKKKGTAVVTARADGEEVARLTVKVLAAPKKVTLSKKSVLMSVGGEGRLTAKLPSKTASKLTWKSDNPSVASVDDDGLVTALSEGKATVTVKTFNGKKATCAVTVQSPDAPTEVSFGVKSLSLGLKESVMLVPTVNAGAKASFKWSTKNKKIATVTQQGVVTGKKKGSTTITVQTQNGLKATLTVKVLAAPKKLTVSPKTAKLAAGKTLRLKAKLPSKTASQIYWESRNLEVAVVLQDGTVLGCKPGKARITGYTFNGRSAYCDLTVTDGPAGDQALREKLLEDWGGAEWKVTEVVTGGLHATTCANFITLQLREDGSGGLMVYKGVSYTHDIHWGIMDGQLVVVDGENGDALLLRPDAAVEKLYLEAEDATFIFTQGVDPAPYYYPKSDTVPEDVNGRWVADKVSFAVLGLRFRAADIGYVATLEIQDDTVRIRFPDGDKVREYTMKVWYPGDGLYPWESEDRDIVYCYQYLPELDSMGCTIQTETQDNVTVYFRRDQD